MGEEAIISDRMLQFLTQALIETSILEQERTCPLDIDL